VSGRERRLVLAGDADRRQIERELHDGLQQDLVAIVVKLQLARRLGDTDPTAAAALLDEIRHDTQAALDATRALALRIYPPLLPAAGLRAALRAVAPEAKVEVALGAEFPKEIAACVYFCCLELVPGASAITVREEGDTVVFDVVAADASRDLSRLRDRVEALGGRLTTEPCRVSGVLPV
jgi:Histidine kinase